MPYNMLHHHEEDEHIAYLHQHQEQTHHHCELDDNFCQSSTFEDCHHEQHIQQTLADCFACDIHFVKHYEHEIHRLDFCESIAQVQYFSISDKYFRNILQRASNRGPPMV